MPYIPMEYRGDISENVMTPRTEGELNYKLTKAVIDVLKSWGESYRTYNALIGALECAKLELYRRKCSKYEDLKIEENGDVYE